MLMLPKFYLFQINKSFLNSLIILIRSFGKLFQDFSIIMLKLWCLSQNGSNLKGFSPLSYSGFVFRKIGQWSEYNLGR